MLAGSLGSESSCNGGSEAAGPSRTDAQFKPKGTERKQLLARLKGSIEENAKRRKVEELPKVQENSNTGKDQKESDLGTKVRLGGDDRSATESSSTGVQPSIDKGNIVGTVAKTALGHATKREAQSITNLIQAGKAKMTKTKG